MATSMRTNKRAVYQAVKGALAQQGIDSLETEICVTEAVIATLKSMDMVSEALPPVLAPSPDDQGNNVDLADWPEETREVVGLVCKYWGLRPPRKPKKSNGKGEFALWVLGAEELMDACGELSPVLVLGQLRARFEDYMRASNGLAPYTVSGPRSLVKSTRSMAGVIRLEDEDRRQVVKATVAASQDGFYL